MRYKSIDLDPANVSLTRFLSNATGATWTLTETTPGDSLAHQISVVNDSGTDHSAKTAVLTGTDADGRTQTETISLPAGSATVESTKYFLTLTSVVPSASIGADTMDIGFVDELSSKMYVIDHRVNVAPRIQVVVTGTINYDIETITENPFGNANLAAPFTINDQNDFDWVNDANFAGKTATTTDNLAEPGITAFRVVVNSYTDTAELQVYVSYPA